MKADRIPGAVAAQPVPPAVYPHRARAENRAGRRPLGRLADDHHRHLAATALPGAARRQDHEPGMVGRALLHHYFHRMIPLEADQAPPTFRGGSD